MAKRHPHKPHTDQRPGRKARNQLGAGQRGERHTQTMRRHHKARLRTGCPKALNDGADVERNRKRLGEHRQKTRIKATCCPRVD